MNYYRTDIKKFIPEFSMNELTNPKFYFILRNLMPAGLFIYEERSDSEIEVKLDYAVPDYRDKKNGSYIYSAERNFLVKKGFNKLSTYSSVKKHSKYLESVGYKKDMNKENLYVKELTV